MVGATRGAPASYRDDGWWEGRTLSSYLDAAAAATPDALAVVDGARRLTYRELLESAERFATGLRRADAGSGAVVTVDLPNWWEASVAMHGALRAGSVLNPVIPIYRHAEVGFILAQARPRVVVIPHRFRGFDYVAMLEELVAGLEAPPLVVVVRPDGPLPPGFSTFADFQRDADEGGDRALAAEICILMYTSGTTAEPKGVLHNHETLAYENRSIIDLFDLSGSDRVFMGSPVTHITGLLYGVLLPPMLGTACALLDVWDPKIAAELIEAERCRFTVSATPFLQGLTDVYEARATPSALRVFACGGADVPPELVRRSRTVLGGEVMRIYGSTEFPTFSCGLPDGDVRIAAETDGLPIGPVGWRLDEAIDGVGELLVRGPECFLGYLDAALNADAFTPDGFFRTGDLASVDESGAVTIRGRRKDIIVRGGENISAKEVEDLLYEHPDIEDVAIVAMPDRVMVEKACAFVVVRSGSNVGVRELAAYLDSRRIARQKYPERVEVVAALPRTQSGKIQKYVLREEIRTRLAAEAAADASS